jgi:hypothetical protein
MEKQFMPESPFAERIEVMQNTAEKVRHEEYLSDLTPSELDQKREEFSLNAIELNKIEERKKKAIDDFKAEMKPFQLKYSELLDQITVGKERKTGRLFDMIDHESGTMVTWDETGAFVAQRRLTPEEKKGQSRLFIPSAFDKTDYKSKAANE